MKKIILLTLTIFGLYANTLENKETFKYPYNDYYMVLDYTNNHGGIIDFDLASKLNTDFNWLKGNEFLTSKKNIKNLTSESITKHNVKEHGTNKSLEMYKGARKLLTPYTSSKTEDALKEFYQSATKNNNPLASFQGLTLLFDYHNNNSKLNKKYREKFATHLIQNNICWGFLVLGDMYKDGSHDISKDSKKAFKIYGDGMPICKQKVFKSWQHKHLSSRYFKLKRFNK